MTLFLRGAAIVLVVALLVSVFWWRTLAWTGQLRPVNSHFEGECTMVTGIPGPEDLVIDRQNRVVFVTSHDRRNSDSDGSIWMLSVDDPAMAVKLPLHGMSGKLAPHGLDLFIDADGKRYLFVIDHGTPGTELVHRFLFEEGTLALQKSFSHTALYSPNDIAAVGLSRFYVTNDSKNKTGSTAAFLEAMLRQKTGSLAYMDGEQARIVYDKIAYANGVAVSKDGKQVYASSTTGQQLQFFDRNEQTGALSLTGTLPLQTGLDNIDVDEDGNLWIGSHPRLLDFSAHAKDGANRSPSQVLRLSPKDKAIHEVYLSDGDPLSASSVGARFEDKLFIGGVFDPYVLACKLPKEEPKS